MCYRIEQKYTTQFMVLSVTFIICNMPKLDRLLEVSKVREVDSLLET